MRIGGIEKRSVPWILLSVLVTYLYAMQSREVQRLSASYPFPENFRFETPYFGLTYAGESGNFIDSRVIRYGAYEKPELFLLRRAAGKRKGLVFLDVGANSGTYSLFMSQIVAQVHAIEPFPPVLTRLRHNLELNHLTNVEVHPVGFGKENGSLPFYAPPTYNIGTGSFSGNISEKWRGSAETREGDQLLPLVVGDEYLQNRGINHIDIMKVDIEGFEKFALQGLQRTLMQSRPYVLLELNVNNAEGFRSLQDLKSVFPPHYRLYEIAWIESDLLTGSSRLVELTRIPRNVEMGIEPINVLAVPEEQALTL